MRTLVGLLLITAATLKAVQLVTEPAAAFLHSLGQYLLPVQTGLEMALGLLVLSGLYWRTLRWFVSVLFTGFAAYSLYLALAGATSCGCFGSVSVNPWWTFGLDLAVAVSLVFSTAIDRRYRKPDGKFIEQYLVSNLTHRRLIAVSVAVVALIAVFLFRYMVQRTALAGGLTSLGDLVVLEPTQWVGQKLPVADAIDIDLSHGDWIVLLHRHDCAVCQEVVSQYEQQAVAGKKIALIEVPPYGDFKGREKACRYGRLKGIHEWIVQTPVELKLQNGIVTAAQTHDY